ncbi:alpha/beta fold hydrolase [Pseudonocardia alaniniphila]|uniref:Alpha/beta hydrolase n=1 Tax=Pseudonocardia alaniniphila TaxID=75291 RepID=A0ABS9TUA6_9PSEU|nr:alpha/beta hydrolase [Pseudonocardia alaniniphila]MCH6172155.1 alpha/beta hydrolase [Pseudonocardia alaniniphila]
MTGTILTGTVPVEGGHIAYELTGEGAPLVFLHGGAMDMRMWEPQLALAADHTVVRLDARGHGSSSTPIAPFRQCDDVAATLHGLGIGSAVLVGLSMGAATALDTALEHPALVTAVVSCGAGASSMAPLDERMFSDPWSRGRLAALAAAQAAFDAQAWTEAFLELGLVGPYRELSDVAPAVVALCREMITDTLTTHVVHGGPPPIPVADAARRAAGIGVPVLGVVGAIDSPDHVRMVRELVDVVPAGRLAGIENSGHMPNLDQPELFNDTLRRFLAAVG